MDERGVESKRAPSSSKQSRTCASPVKKKSKSPTDWRRTNGASLIAETNQHPPARIEKESKKSRFGSSKVDGPFKQKHGSASATGSGGNKRLTKSRKSNRTSPEAASNEQSSARKKKKSNKKAAGTKMNSPVRKKNGRTSATGDEGRKRLQTKTAGNTKRGEKQSRGSSGQKSASKGKKTQNRLRGTRSVVHDNAGPTYH